MFQRITIMSLSWWNENQLWERRLSHSPGLTKSSQLIKACCLSLPLCWLQKLENPTYMYIELFTASSYLFYQPTILISHHHPTTSIWVFPTRPLSVLPPQVSASAPAASHAGQGDAGIPLLVFSGEKTGIACLGHICLIMGDGIYNMFASGNKHYVYKYVCILYIPK